MVTVTVSQTYKSGCPECAASVASMVLQAIKDKQVTGITLRTQPKCEHETVNSRFPSEAATKALKGQPELPGMPRPTGYEQ